MTSALAPTPRFAVGDLQGCFAALQALLRSVPWAQDGSQLWLVGDLVNRGPQSCETLQFLFTEQARVRAVLGNHDLYALSRWVGLVAAKKSDTLTALLSHPQSGDWLDWLRHRPLLYRDHTTPWTMVHAAIHPDWSVEEAEAHAQTVEAALRGPRWVHFLRTLWAEAAPASWKRCRSEDDAQRFRVAVFTRARWMRADGVFSWPSEAPADTRFLPWHRLFLARQQGSVVCGHWATQGLLVQDRLLALDSGCVWGRQLSAAELGPGPVQIHQVSCPPRPTRSLGV